VYFTFRWRIHQFSRRGSWLNRTFFFKINTPKSNIQFQQLLESHPSQPSILSPFLRRSIRPSRLRHLLPRNLHPHSLIPYPRRPALMSLWHTRHAFLLHARPARPTDNLLLAGIIASPEIITKTRLALIVAATFGAETGVAGRTFFAESPVAVVICVAVCGFFARATARWRGWEAADWVVRSGFAGDECEDVGDGIRVAGCVDVVGDDSDACVFWWRLVGICPLPFADGLD
jgi:hypothetical protein